MSLASLRVGLVAGLMLMGGCCLFSSSEDDFIEVTSPLDVLNSDDAVIRAVHDHLEGKVVTRWRTVEVETTVPCTPTDSTLDVLGMTCSGSGGLHGLGFKPVYSYVEEPTEEPCAAPPAVDSPAWTLVPVEEDAWIVRNPQGSWNVTGSDGLFEIEPQQDC